MKEQTTAYGTLRIAPRPDLFRRLADIFEATAATCGDRFTVGLTGGSTPKAFYRWVVENNALSASVRNRAAWCVSDERFVPLDDPESNFGNADRDLLTPLGIREEHKFPWPVSVDPHSAGRAFAMRFADRFGSGKAFDLCLLGMGEDGHTASIFPDSPLMAIRPTDFFAPVQVPGKGWRLSITPEGFGACGRIVVMVTGSAKADRLKAVFAGPQDVYPVQLLAGHADRVEWLVDPEAGSGLAQTS